MSKARRGLGRGLPELLGGGSAEGAGAGTREVETQMLQPGPWQPRRHFDQQRLAELAETMKKRGVLQPILVQQAGDRMRIVAGERRWRAAQLAGLRTVPVVVREMSDREAMAAALIENLQRDDLHPLEQADAIHLYMKDRKGGLADVATELGMSRPALSNLLRLRELAAAVRRLFQEGKLTAGHARAIVSLPASRQEAVARQVVERALSVRQTEELIAAMQGRPGRRAGGRRPDSSDGDTAELCGELSDLLGMRVGIRHGRDNRGRMTIDYRSLDSLDALIAMIRQSGEGR